MLRLKGQSGDEININPAHVVMFRPSAAGSEVLVTGGVLYSVQESTRTIRHQIKKAAVSTAEE